MDHTTTTLELLSMGATIESADDSSIVGAIQVTDRHTNWLHNLNLSALLRKGAVITMVTGLGLMGVDDQVVIFDEAQGQYEILSTHPQSEDGIMAALEDMDFFDFAEAVA